MEHDKCNVGKVLARRIEVVLENIPSTVSEEHISHKKEQASQRASLATWLGALGDALRSSPNYPML